MPAYRGLYAAALPPLAAAFFASSPYLQTGPVALTALLTFGALTALAPAGSPEYVQLGILLALVVGVARLLVGLLRAGVVAYLMSQPMLMGFVPAAAVLILASQLPTAFGAEAPGDGVLPDGAWTLVHPGAWETPSILLAVCALAVVVAGPRLHRLFPAVLVAVGAGIAYSLAAGYGGPKVGAIPEGLPPFSFRFPWSDLHRLLLPGVVIALVGFAEPSSIARTFAAQERRPWSSNREFVSQGVANVVSSVSGGFPVGGSFSRSALNRLAGARTRWSGAVTGIAVLCFLPFASSLASLPRAVLGAIVIGAVLGLIRVMPLFRLWRYSKPQFAVAWATFGLTLGLSPHVERAVLAGIGLAIAVHLARELSLDVEQRVDGDTLHLEPTGVLWFGSSRLLEDTFLGLLPEHPEVRRLVIHLGGLGRVDLSGALALRALVQDARAAGLEVGLEDVPPRAQRWVGPLIEPEADPLGTPAGRD